MDQFKAFLDLIDAQTRSEHEALRALPVLYFPRSVRLPQAEQGWFDLAFTVTYEGGLAILRSNVDVVSDLKRHSASRQPRREFRLPAQARARLSVFDGEQELEPVETSLRFPTPFFDRLADGSWILADQGPGKPDCPNAMIVSQDGAILRRFELGCSIQQLQADPTGGFWVGYGDEGRFSPDHGVEAGGVVRFDPSGSAVWNLNARCDENRHAWCDHSYALNVTREGRWCYTYTGFLLTHLDAPGGPRSLRPMLDFADAIAVCGDRVMMAGSLRPNGRGHGLDRLALFGPPNSRTPRRLSPLWAAAVHRAVNPVGRLWTARGDTLHCVRGRTWHRLSIAEADALYRQQDAAGAAATDGKG